ncbi:hypothetical protein SUGI_0446790 [Cryptomeria japonica]|nr:hypothetical protein SUGI_0446790 [Cryptomeria japonica]
MVLGNNEVHTASSIKIMWQHTPWLVSLLTKGPVRLLPHTLKGMDLVSIARLFANGRCIGEHIIGEEVVLYICGQPFVLRELYQPVDTLKHVGIKGHVVEHMEARLKEEILSEIARSGWHVILHREELNPLTNQPDIIGYSDIKTPAEVYATLKVDEHMPTLVSETASGMMTTYIPSTLSSQPRINSPLVMAIRMVKAATANSEDSSRILKVYVTFENQNKPHKAFTTERAKEIGVANAAGWWIFVTVPPYHFGPILGENGPDPNQDFSVKDACKTEGWA